MATRVRRTAATLIAAGALAVGVATPASAQVEQDGLVNVNVGNVEIIEDVRVAVAAQVAAAVCGVKVGPVAVLGRAVDRSGDTSTVCTNSQGPITISQN